MAKPLYLIKRDGHGSGGFLCPPGHPNHSYSVEGYWGGRVKPVSGPDLIAGLDYLLEDEYRDVPAGVKARARQITDRAELTCSEAWVRYVYGYFRNSYSPDGTDRNVSHAISVSGITCACGEHFWGRPSFQLHLNRALTAMLRIRSRYTRTVRDFPAGPHRAVTLTLPPEHHLGYLRVREHFPDHQPRLDLIADPGHGHGAGTCTECGHSVQYEARYDALCVVKTQPWSWDPDCPEGSRHEIGEPS